MSPYTRPSIAPQVFVDADGQVIDYGRYHGPSGCVRASRTALG